MPTISSVRRGSKVESENAEVSRRDLVMAHRVRAGVHRIMPEDDRFELEALFVGLIRAAMTFVEVRQRAPKPRAAPSPCL
jgi:hypothetical protein